MSARNPIDTETKVATCVRCGEYVLTAMAAGLNVAVDITPLDADAYVACLLDGRPAYDLVNRKLRPRTASLPPSDHILGTHGCGAKGMDAVQVEEIPENPQKAPVEPRRPSDGPHHPSAPDRASAGRTGALTPPSPAEPASPHRSERARMVCDRCKQVIHPREWQFTALQIGDQVMWAQHEWDCAPTKKRVRMHDVGIDAYLQLDRDDRYKKVEDVNLPE